MNISAVHMAGEFAGRLESETSDPKMQIERAYGLTLGRKPTVEESVALVAYGAEHGLTAACRLMFNLNEFAFAE